MSSNLFAALYPRVAANGQRIFLQCPGHAPLSYAAGATLAARYASVLEQLGVAPGDRVVAQVDKSSAALVLYLACLRLGAVYVPLNTAYTAAETAFFLADCEPRLFVVATGRMAEQEANARRAGVGALIPLLGADDSLERRAATSPPSATLAPVEDSDLAAIIYTSGTTGRPKGAMLTTANLRSNAVALHQAWGWQDDDVLLHALPIFHVHGLFVALHCAMLGGSRVLFLPRFDVAAVRAALPQATVMMGVPTFYTRLLADAAFGRGECHQMRLFISGSAPLSPQTFAEFETRTGHQILERYGMSEAGIITSNPLHGERLPGTVGYPLPDVVLRVVDAEGGVLGADQVGELQIRGPNLFAGYWRQRDKMAEVFRADGFFPTGDLGTLAEDGRVAIVGRARDLIISGGYNVYPREIEHTLDGLPGIRESAVIGVPHPDLGEAVVAVVVSEEPGEFDEATVQADLSSCLARFKHPKRFVLTDQLPRNAMGKVQKNTLRDQHRNTFTSPS